MSERCVKLTTYFGERDRAARRLLSDELLDIYADHGVRASVLLRGAEGFGRLHHLHTDRLLSLSEDLPVVSIALDTPERIEMLLPRVVAVTRKGLITLERARLAAIDGAGADTATGDARAGGEKLTVFVGRRERVGRRAAFAQVCDVLHRHGLGGASVLLGVDGLRGARRERARFFSRNAEVPLMIEAVGSRERVAAVLPELRRMLSDPLITLERARICKRDGELLEVPHELSRTDEHGRALWQKLTVYSSHSAMHGGRPLHLEIVRRLRASDSAGITCVSGIWGFHGDRPPHGDRLLQVRRHVPVVTVAIDSPERIARSFAIVDELTGEHGLVTSEVVPAMRALSDAEQVGSLRLAEPS
jgi:PII-like signaling protein